MHGWNEPDDRDEGPWGPVQPAGRAQAPARSEYPDSSEPDLTAELGTFALGSEHGTFEPDPEVETGRGRTGAVPRWTRSGDRQPDGRGGAPALAHRQADQPGGTGRHRRPSRLPGPVGLGIAVTALLGLFGVGAALLPPSLADAPAARPNQPAADAAAPDGFDEPTVPLDEPTEVDDETAAPTPTATPVPRATPKPTATTARPPRTTRPPVRRTSARAPAAASQTGDSREAQVLEIVNRERAANGCGSVVINSDLAEAARLHSQDQGEHTNMSHTGSDGSDFVERARRAGYDSPIGENVAMGYATPAAVMEGWMNSSGHRANILNCNAKAMGVGVATGADGRLYWTQVFGSAA
ncbi:CAP domain-containing protein [Plantactinospora solaniradicis]|uniref:CAP domain-containing protein n=1 Tax=Plantactinospora solaniradicis TaxID=1723736 RepID=A0ABW1K8T8_9ACTN